MRLSDARSLFVAAVLSLSTACTQQAYRDNSPFGNATEPDIFYSFARDYEVMATLRLSSPTSEENYLLAISTRKDSLTAALLTPQGLPVFSVSARDNRLQAPGKTALDILVRPVQLINYLELLYVDEVNILALLRDSWQCQHGPGRRRFLLLDAAQREVRNIEIDYLGKGPWYSSATLQDSHNSVDLEVTILESIHDVFE